MVLVLSDRGVALTIGRSLPALIIGRLRLAGNAARKAAADRNAAACHDACELNDAGRDQCCVRSGQCLIERDIAASMNSAPAAQHVISAATTIFVAIFAIK
jgi:hypothetical protein